MKKRGIILSLGSIIIFFLAYSSSLNHSDIIKFNSPTYSDNSYISSSIILYNITLDYNISNITVILFNRNGYRVKHHYHNFTGNYSIFGNFSSLLDGIYYLNATIFDLSGKKILSDTRKIFLDKRNPTIKILNPSIKETYIADIQTINFEYVADDNFYISNCSLLINNKTRLINELLNLPKQTYRLNFEPGVYIWQIKCTDLALNTAYSQIKTFTIIPTKVTITNTSDNYTNKTIYSNDSDLDFDDIDDTEDFSNYSEHFTDIKEIGSRNNCDSNWDCTEWYECKPSFKMQDIINNTAYLEGKEIRICRDINNCFYDKIQERKCTQSIPIKIKEVVKCFDKQLEIYNSNNSLISRLSIGNKSNINIKLNLEFTFGSDYCNYCYNSKKDFDEEGIDCGGENCPKCTEFIYSRNIMDVVKDMFNTLYNLFLDNI